MNVLISAFNEFVRMCIWSNLGQGGESRARPLDGQWLIPKEHPWSFSLSLISVIHMECKGSLRNALGIAWAVRFTNNGKKSHSWAASAGLRAGAHLGRSWAGLVSAPALEPRPRHLPCMSLSLSLSRSLGLSLSLSLSHAGGLHGQGPADPGGLAQSRAPLAEPGEAAGPHSHSAGSSQKAGA